MKNFKVNGWHSLIALTGWWEKWSGIREHTEEVDAAVQVAQVLWDTAPFPAGKRGVSDAVRDGEGVRKGNFLEELRAFA